MNNKISRTDEAKLTGAFRKYCTKRNIPFICDVNGVTIKGWASRPDAIIGTENDDAHTKCVILEFKPTREGALNDLKRKEEYRCCKYLAAVYWNGEEMVGQKASWLKPDSSVGFNLIGAELPLNRLIDGLYETYQRTTNPIKTQIVEFTQDLIKQGQYTEEQIFNVFSGSFCDVSKPAVLGHSLGQLWDMCVQIPKENSFDKLEVMDKIVFNDATRDQRYQLGQFITEYPWTLKIAELVVEEFDKRKDFTLYEPCIGTGAITCEVITLLFRKYGKQKAEKIIKEQLLVADIDPEMRGYAEVALWNHTKKLFGQGINVKIQESNLTKDSFDLSRMIVFGNYPFNAGNDYNYLAKILRKQLDCELSHMVLMGNSTTFDPNKTQSRKILGDNFYNWIEEKYSTNDFQQVAVKISVIILDRNRKNNVEETKFDSAKFTTLEKLNVEISMISKFSRGVKYANKTRTVISNAYDISRSIEFITQKTLTMDKGLRVPLPTAPEGSIEREVYEQYTVEKGTYPKCIRRTFLAVGSFTTPDNIVVLKYYYNVAAVSSGAGVFTLKGTPEVLSIIGLIYTSQHFRKELFQHFPKCFQGHALYLNKQKSFPIPIENEINKASFERLREIGQILIIEGKEDNKLREEADRIIEGLYNGASN
jgi:hypothetical protein